MSELCDRLKEERARLEYKRQDALAEKLGVSTTSVSNYESGKRLPDAAYLVAFAELGADVLYVLTGQRAVGVLAADEAGLVDAYRAAPEAVRKAALAALLTGQTRGDTFIVHGNVGARIDGSATIGEINMGGKKRKR